MKSPTRHQLPTEPQLAQSAVKPKGNIDVLSDNLLTNSNE